MKIKIEGPEVKPRRRKRGLAKCKDCRRSFDVANELVRTIEAYDPGDGRPEFLWPLRDTVLCGRCYRKRGNSVR